MSSIQTLDQIDPAEVQRLLAVMEKIKAANPDAPDPFETRELELDLSAFIKQAWPILEPGTPFIGNWHIDLICEYLTAVTRGEVKRLLINMPPRHSKPVSVESLVLMGDGRRKRLGDVVVGDTVITHSGRPQVVTEIHDQGEIPCVRVKTWHGREVIAAPDHPFLTPDGWVNAGELVEGVALASVPNPELNSTGTEPVWSFRLAGYLIGDGSTKGSAAVLTSNDETSIEDSIECAKRLGFNANVVRSEKACPRVNFSGGIRPWLRLHGMAGKGSYDKRVPDFVFNGDTEKVAHFIGAYFACDGTLNRRGSARKDCCVSITSVNRPLLLDIQHLLLRIGVRSRIRDRCHKNGSPFVKSKQPYYFYNLEISSMDDVERFRRRIPVFHRKAMKLDEWATPRTRFDELFLADTVSSIEDAGLHECRCLTVDGDESFTVNDLVVHNSSIVTVMWPVWEWATNPTLRYIFSSYATGLSIKHNLDRRAIIQSEWYQSRWGHRVQLSGDSNLKSEFTNTKRGVMLTTSTGASPLGRGGDRVVIDDPQNPEEAFSANEREAAIRFFDQTLSTRLDQPEKGAFIIVMQRLHEMDLTGHLLQSGEYVHLKIPTEAEEREVIHFPISGREVVREKGDLLWPERVGPNTVASMRRSLGPWGFAAQHQQRPVPQGGGIFANDWWKFYDQSFAPFIKPHARRIVMFLDTAQQKGKLNDYSVAAIWAEVNHKITDEYQPGYYLLDLWRDRVDFPDLIDKVVELRSRYYLSRIVIENKASGISLAQMLQKQRIPVELFNPDKDKEARAHATSGFVRDGLCYLPREARWLPEFLEEHSNFPKVEHDDIVDTTSQMLSYYELNKVAGTPLVKFRRNKTKIKTAR